MKLDLDGLDALDRAATPGPWTIEYPGDAERAQPAHLRMQGEFGPHEILVDHRRDLSSPLPDAAFIVASRNSLKALVAEVRAAREWLKDYDIAGTAGGRAARETYRKVVEENSRD